MNKIFNWTIGSVFRTLGRIFAYLLVGVLLGLFMQKNGLKLTDLLGIDTIYAETQVSTQVNKYSVRVYSTDSATETWTSFYDNGQFFNTGQSSLYFRAIRARFGSSDKFQKGKTYRVKLNVIFENGNRLKYKTPNNVVCYGSTDNNFTMNTDFIDTCQFVAMSLYDDNTRAHYYFDVKPNTTIYGLQVQYYYSDGNMLQTSLSTITPLTLGTGSSVSYDDSEIGAINNQTNTLINNNNQNTQDIINNNNENSQNIINNQNEMLGNKCENLYTGNIHTGTDNKLALDLTNLQVGKTYTISSINNVYVYKFSERASSSSGSDVGPEKWSSTGVKSWTFEYSGHKYLFLDMTSSAGTHFVSSENIIKENKFMVVEGSSSKPYCEYGSYSSKLDSTNQAIDNLNDSINDDNTSGATSSAGGFFSSFTTDTHGLTGIITAPLTAINRLTSTSCSPLVLPLPYVNQNLTLPCMRPIYTSNFGSFMGLYDIIVIGIVSYWILVRIFALVKDFKNPDHDEIEVMDL